MKVQVISQALTAAAMGADGLPERFESVLVIEGERTTDDREIAPDALTWRELPLALTNAEDVGDDHSGAVIGWIDEIERVSVGVGRNELRAKGRFDLGSEAGREAARLVGEQLKRWVSIDLEVLDYDLYEEGDCAVPDEIDSEIDYYPGENCKVVMRTLSGRVMGAAMCAFSAFPGAVIVAEGMDIPAATENGRPSADDASEPVVVDAPTSYTLVASGALPPAEWFTDPALDGPTPLTITDDGRVFGHLATWGTCHIGRDDACLTPPTSPAGYAYFTTGETKVACDCPDEMKSVPTGVLTMATGHASLSARHREAAAHYDDTGTAFADVSAGEDAYGIWVAGALRPDLSEAQLRAARASALSGDWRRIGGDLELVAALAVNVPGFPIPRALAASGLIQEAPQLGARIVEDRQLSLVASGVVARRAARTADTADIERRLRRVEELLAPQVVDSLRASVHGV